jgi:regulatory protein
VAEKVASPEELARLAYAASIRLLARRDHSIHELTRKLQHREHSEESIDTAVLELLDLNYLNETRYAELYSEQRMNKGFGPLSIQAKLRERGISAHLIQWGLKQLAVDWSDQAERVIHKRFNIQEISNPEQKVVAKIARFLQSRGYAPSDAIRGLKKARCNIEK